MKKQELKQDSAPTREARSVAETQAGAAPSEAKTRKTKTVAEAARVLGIGRNSAYEAVRSGEIPSVRIGGRIVIPNAALSRLLGE